LREIDKLIAINIFEAVVRNSPFTDKIITCDFPDRKLGSFFPELPKFTTKIEHAFIVAEKLDLSLIRTSSGWVSGESSYIFESDQDSGDDYNIGWGIKEEDSTKEFENPCLAICIAALKTKGIIIDE